MALAIVRPGNGADDGLVSMRERGTTLQSAMIDEVFAQATDDEAAAFFVAVGARLAAGWPLSPVASLASIERTINDAWQALGLGEAALAIDDDGVLITHRGFTTGGRGESDSEAAAAVLRGAYGAWFGSIGGAAALHTRLLLQTSEQITLHHGL